MATAFHTGPTGIPSIDEIKGHLRDGLPTDMWAQPDPFSVEVESLVQRVLQQEGITDTEIVAGDLAVRSCLEAAIEVRSALEEVWTLLTKFQRRGEASAPPPVQDPHVASGSGGSGQNEEATDLLSGTSSIPTLQHQVCLDSPPLSKRKRAAAGQNTVATALDSSLSDVAGHILPGVGANKGLKHFSLKVCEKVESKGQTNYNEVADELVKELAADAAVGVGDASFDEKNVRRRVYDALNVLEALGVISKTKRDITWRGWPCPLSNSEQARLEIERARVAARLQKKVSAVESALGKAFCLSNLVLRNKDAPMPALDAARAAGLPAPTPLGLPFMIIHAPAAATIDLQISADEKTAHMDFKWWPFQVFDDERVMQMMGLGEPRPELMENLPLEAIHDEKTAHGVDDASLDNLNPSNGTTPLKPSSGQKGSGLRGRLESHKFHDISPSAAVSAMVLESPAPNPTGGP